MRSGGDGTATQAVKAKRDQTGRWHKLSPAARQKRLEANRLWRSKNMDKVRAWGRKHYRTNVDKRRTYARKRHAKLRTDPTYLRKMADYASASRLANPEKHFYNRLRTLYKITREQYDAMVVHQNNACAVCLLPESHVYRGKIKRLAVDHCHATGRVRGLLCHDCNAGLGLLKENAETLRRMATWIESQQ